MNHELFVKLLVELLDKEPKLISLIGKCIVQNFTTKKFCKQFNICDEESKEDTRISTNPEFENFFQKIYHAGTISQFFDNAIIPLNLYKPVMTTFHYLFDVFKKGIYVCIEDNNLQVYLPFSNSNYVNDWGQNLKTKKGGFSTVLEIEEKSHWNPPFVPEMYHTIIQRDPNRWYANYCIFRNTVYKNGSLSLLDDEGDKSIANFLELVTEVCFTRVVPDVCFFISPRDFPVLRKDRKHPYDRLYLPNEPPYLGDKYKDLLPIFSQSITDEYADELIPNDDDIVSILCNKTGFYQTNWNNKKPIAVFRGSATGCGTTPENNPRLKLFQLAKDSKLIDAKLIGLNDKIKVDENGFIATIDTHNYPKMDKRYKEENKLSPEEQSEYKYIIHVEGHVAAFRLTRELAYKSVILKIDSNWKTWYSDLLIGWSVDENRSLTDREKQNSAHYIRIKPDLSNLVKTIEWCKQHDSICKGIAERALKFWEDHFEKPDFMLNYMQNKLIEFSKIQKKINLPNPSTSHIPISPPKRDQVSKEHKGIIIIPFRDSPDHERQKQLDQLTKFLDGKMDYKVIIQTDSKPFNRGLLLNKGFKENQDYDYFIFHDADLIPDSELFPYYLEFPIYPMHLGYRGQRYSKDLPISWPKNKFIGGVLSVNKSDFIRANGFPNTFAGWGKEDDALSYRFHINGIPILFPPEGAVTDLEGLTIEQKMAQLKFNKEKNMTGIEQLEEDKKNWFKNGLKQL